MKKEELQTYHVFFYYNPISRKSGDYDWDDSNPGKYLEDDRESTNAKKLVWWKRVKAIDINNCDNLRIAFRGSLQ